MEKKVKDLEAILEVKTKELEQIQLDSLNSQQIMSTLETEKTELKNNVQALIRKLNHTKSQQSVQQSENTTVSVEFL